ncbi:DUF2802 domain-containing protein [uncultured Thiocystis sp.]|uniref:DUF2802 domain-containing protein n=1 Tax=uncultured Thiocystis sp. TaxID=1202134 RepID=UPI0025FE7525|nr:DUF2802 domain-containing protein [uncultured Thiocystis sp.]
MNETLLFGVALALFVLTLLVMLLAGVALKSISTLRRQIREIRQDHQRQNTSLLALHGAMKMISEDVISHGQAQSSVRRTLEHLADRQNEMRLRDVDDGLYPQAIQLIQAGRAREEVRKLCGLTDSEVDLLFSLHGRGLGVGASSVASTRP